jgi:linoleoyl-CoA desaturase
VLTRQEVNVLHPDRAVHHGRSSTVATDVVEPSTPHTRRAVPLDATNRAKHPMPAVDGRTPDSTLHLVAAVMAVQDGDDHTTETIDPPVPAASVARLWRGVMPTPDEVRTARRHLQANAVLILGLVATSYWCLVLSSVPLLLRLSAAGVLVIALVAVGTSIMHDANHDSFSTRRWVNRALAYTSDALGASSWLWRFQHNTLHHGNPNVVGFDADIALAPFARLAPSQPWHRWYRAQHVYIWPIYGFLALTNLLVSDVVALISGRLDQQPLRQRVRPAVVAQIIAGKLAHLGWAVVIPLLFNPWWAVLAFYLTCSWLVGFLLAITFQLAHCVDITTMYDSTAPRRGDDFASHQLATTADIATPLPVIGHLVRWLVGGLDHQIEHHLAPRLPHTIYPLLADRFRQACHDNGITYRLHPGVWSALRSHTRWLRAMSIRMTIDD